MNLKHQLYKALTAWVVLFVFIAVTRPSTMPVVGLILPFVLLYVALYNSSRFVKGLRARYMLTVFNPSTGRRTDIVTCLTLVLMVVLQSLGQLTVRDVITMGAILIIGYLYVTRSRETPAKR